MKTLRIFNTVIHVALNMEQIIHQFSAYDLWANTRIVERLQRESPSVLDRHVKSSFPSLRLTLMHIRDAGNAWYQRVFALPPLGFGDGIDSLLKQSTAMRDKVQAMGEKEMKESVSYARGDGGKYIQPRWQMLMHCYNHASYHRGQVITIMRQLDLGEVPNTDLVAYQRLLLAKP